MADPASPDPRPSLSVLLPTKREAENLPALLEQLQRVLTPHVAALEILIADTPTGDGSEAIAARYGARYVTVPGGFADALRAGFAAARHEWVATMDADGSHDPAYITWMLRRAAAADIVIGSRYVPRGGQQTSWFRYVTSRVLNYYLQFVCSLPVQDLSGGFKLYRRAIFREFAIESGAFEVQSEIAIKAYGHGFRLREMPFYYHPRVQGRSKAAIWRYGWAFLFASLRLRAYRNSRAFCDYDERAYNSLMPLQRYWQRERFARLTRLLPPRGRSLDVGCGSGRVILAWPGVVGVDVNPCVLRYLRHEERRVVQANGEQLPFADGSFDQVYCCEVAEHLPPTSRWWAELARVLAPGGKLLVTTPDYGHAWWPALERVQEWWMRPTGHAHLTRFTRDSLAAALRAAGLTVTAQESMFGAILFAVAAKPAAR